jgi:predicted dehydrogenase
MKLLIIGLGSMGKRRIRNLKTLGINRIIGFDLREDRRKEAKEKYNIETIENLNDLDLKAINAIIISTPPDIHNQYIKFAIDNKKPAFVEASVILKGLENLNRLAKKKKILIAPSCTMRFHPAIKKIKEIVKSGKYGKITNFSYHSGQYLPDWHPWEKVTNYYVSKRETGGAREIVPFELTWLTDVFGFPKKIIGFFGKTTNVGADIDDTYVISMDFRKFFGNMLIDVVSRYATRSLILNMEKAQLLWRWDTNYIKLYEAINKKWKRIFYKKGESAEGYDKSITEDMYVEEIKMFVNAIKGKGKFPNSLEDDIKVLKLLHKIEGKL